MIQFANDEKRDLRQSEQANRHSERIEESQFSNIRTERPKFCIHCGTRLEDENDFCTECGAKIELEVFESEEGKESTEICENQSESILQKSVGPAISSDRMASIAETATRKLGANAGMLKKLQQTAQSAKTDEIKKLQQTAQIEKSLAIQNKPVTSKNKLIYGMYIYKDSERTMYLKIENISGKSVQACIKAVFVNGGYATENFTGTLSEDEITLKLSDCDLHPPPKETQTSYSETGSRISIRTRTITHRILVDTSFSGIVTEDSISGRFTGEVDEFCVFRRV